MKYYLPVTGELMPEDDLKQATINLIRRDGVKLYKLKTNKLSTDGKKKVLDTITYVREHDSKSVRFMLYDKLNKTGWTMERLKEESDYWKEKLIEQKLIP